MYLLVAKKKGIKSTNGIQIETPFPHQCNTGNKNIHHMSHGYLKKKLTINVNKAYWVENHHFLSAAEKKKKHCKKQWLVQRLASHFPSFFFRFSANLSRNSKVLR